MTIDGLYPFNQTVVIRDVTIHDNSWNYESSWASTYGKGSGIISDVGFIQKIEIENVHIYNQENTLYAAAIYARADSLIIKSSHISDCGNGVIGFSATDVILENVLVKDCWNNRGLISSHIIEGAIGSSAYISNCTIVDSYADHGRAVYIGAHYIPDNKTALIENSIIDNSCPSGSELGYYSEGNIDFVVRYSNIDGGWEGVGNIDLDPLFTDPENDDYTFLSDSPCIDAGNPDSAYNDSEDPNHTGWPLWPSQGTLRNDMGCYGGPGAIDLWDYQDVPVRPQQPVQPETIELFQNYPNPFNPTTTIEFTLPYPQDVQLGVYNVLGQRVAVIANGTYGAGLHRVEFDGAASPSGIYIYRLNSETDAVAGKMILVR